MKIRIAPNYALGTYVSPNTAGAVAGSIAATGPGETLGRQIFVSVATGLLVYVGSRIIDSLFFSKR